VGSQFPAAIHEVDLEALEIRATLELSGEVNESVYGVCLLPDDFGDPPATLFSCNSY